MPQKIKEDYLFDSISKLDSEDKQVLNEVQDFVTDKAPWVKKYVKYGIKYGKYTIIPFKILRNSLSNKDQKDHINFLPDELKERKTTDFSLDLDDLDGFDDF